MKAKRAIPFLLAFLFQIGFADWVYGGERPTDQKVSFPSEEVTVTIHNVKKQSTKTFPTEYYVPETVEVNEDAFLSPTDPHGNTKTEKWGEVGGGWKTIAYDEKPQYFNIRKDSTYVAIDTHNRNLGPEQIQNKQINVTKWKTAESDQSWADVWNVGYKGEPFYFFADCDDEISFKQTYSNGDLLPSTSFSYEKDPYYDEKTNTVVHETIYERSIVRDFLKQARGEKGAWIFKIKYIYGYYYPTVQYRKVVTRESVEKTEKELSTSIVKLKKGSHLSQISSNLTNYNFMGYYSDENCTSLFDFKSPINSNTNIYLKYVDKSENDSLSKRINNLSSGSINAFNHNGGGTGGTGTSFDIAKDDTYNSATSTCFLSSEKINNGTTVSLTYDDGKIHEDPYLGQITESLGNHRTSSDGSISNEYSNSTNVGLSNCATLIALTNSLTIEGTLNVGAKVGAYTNGTKYSYIIGKYALLDLYGHTLTIDGGTLNAWGVIQDSVGGGKIVVKNNGVVTATLSVSDGRAVRQMMLSISKRQSPFTEYQFPYLNVPIHFENGTTFNSYLKFDIGEFGASSFEIGFLGKTNALFLWGDQNGSVDYIPSTISSLNSNAVKKDRYNKRNKLIFAANIKQNYNVELTIQISLSLGSSKATLDFGRIDFPISPFFDIVVKKGNSLSISSKMTFYPGSSLYVEKGARLDFTYAGVKTYKATSRVVVAGETRFLIGGIMSYTNRISDLASYGYSAANFSTGFYNSSEFWNVSKTANIVVDGSITFNNDINLSNYKYDDHYYLFSGQINLSNDALKALYNAKTNIRTYDLKAELCGGHLFESTNTDSKYQFERAASYNINPLISNGWAYILDSGRAIKGKYISGVISDSFSMSLTNDSLKYTSQGKNYFLKTSTDMYEDGSGQKNQESRINKIITIDEATSIDSNFKTLQSSDGTYYVLYKGLYVPVNSSLDGVTLTNGTQLDANCRKFMSNKDVTDYDKNATKYDSVLLSFDSVKKEWRYKGFSS